MGKLRAGDFRFGSITAMGIKAVCIAAMCMSMASKEVPAQAAAAPETRCAALIATHLAGAKVTSAVVVPEKTAMPDAPMGAHQVRVMPAFCRVKVTDTPSADSEIETEVWLPLAGWMGRLRGVGNGGFAGEIAYEQMGGSVIEGAAVAGTDAGHMGGTPGFALGHPEKVKDFGWRAVHDMTVQAKALVAAFYGKAATTSYFTACSDGGREALMEAQRFPEDYDGILAGAPAYNWTGLVSAGAKDMHVMHATAASDLPSAKLPAIGAAVRAACDARDGVADGILNDPRTCGFDPATLACKGAETDSCLTAPQVASLKEMYTAKQDAQGKAIFPGYLPGAEDAPGSWGVWVTGPQSAMIFFGTGFFADFVHEDPAWTLAQFDLDKDYKLATAKVGPELNATDTNLKPFLARGGKLVMYHGWNDPAIPALSSVRYYDGLVNAMGKTATESAVRLYMVPGMLHCSGGPGATSFGEDGAPAVGEDHNIFTALEQWVENKQPPGNLIATKYANGDAMKPAAMTRPVCVYPATVTYVKGDMNDAKSFACVATAK